MMTPEEMAKNIPGLTLEQARRVTSSVKKQETPNALGVRRLFAIPAPYMGLWWCGEVAPGFVRLEVYADFTDVVDRLLTDNEMTFRHDRKYHDGRLDAVMQSYIVMVTI